MSRGFRLSRARKAWLYSAVSILFFSGVLWLFCQSIWMEKGEFGETPHPSAPLWMKIHGAAAMIFLVIFGTLLRDHVRGAWRAHRNRGSGFWIVAVALALTATGYGLYYFGSENLRPTLSKAHWILGLLWPLVIVLHIALGKRSRRVVH